MSRAWVLAWCLLGFSLGFYLVVRQPAPEPQDWIPKAAPERLSESHLEAIESAVRGVEQPSGLPNGPVYLALRSQGVKVADRWVTAGSPEEAIRRGLEEMTDPLTEPDTLELCLTHTYREADPDDQALELARGLIGLELTYGNATRTISPTSMISENLSVRSSVGRFLQSQGQDPRATLRRRFKLRTLQGYQLLVSLVGPPKAVEMVRGNTPVEEPDNEALTEGLATWLMARVEEDGALPYLVFPSTGRSDEARALAVRHWLATWALARLAGEREDAIAAYEKNLRHNLQRFFRTDGRRGLIYEDTRRGAPLGGLGLAGVAILDGPLRSEFAFVEKALREGLLSMWHPDGSFDLDALVDLDEHSNNFYPGEALLFAAALYRHSPDPELKKRFFASIEYYRRWHLEHRVPAFVPWHTQACARMWDATRDPELAAWIFEMNDWLLGEADMQQWAQANFPDFKGQFWNPEQPEFGAAPHVSSTGVYMEGLAEAYRVARALKDAERAERYRTAFARGAQSLRQHQFADAVDVFYVAEPEMAKGALRTTVYNNVVRIDNVAHALNAMLAARRVGL